MPLDNAARAKLDGIVTQMDAQGASTEEIQAVVDDFKRKYEAPVDASAGAVSDLPGGGWDQAAADESQPGPISRFASGVKRSTIDPLLQQGAAAGKYVGDHALDAVLTPASFAVGAMRDAGVGAFRGAQEGAEAEFTKMYEQNDRGGLEDRGPTGRGLSPVGHAIAGAVPLIGPMAAGSVERMASGDVAGGLGEITGMVGMSEAGRAVTAGAGSMVRAGEAGAVARSGMENVRGAAAATDKFDLATPAAKKALANETLGVKPKHLRTGYQPAEQALESGIDVRKPRGEVLPEVQSQLDTLSAQKKTLLDKPRVAATGKDIREVADSFKPAIEAAKATGNGALAKRLVAARKTIRGFLDPKPDAANPMQWKAALGENLSPSDVETVISRVDEMIDSSTGSAGRKVRQQLYKVRRQLSDLQSAGDPELRPINTKLRNFLKAKEALKEAMMGDEAAPPPKNAPAPGEGTAPPDELSTGLDPADMLDAASLAGAPFASLLARGLRLGRRITKR